MTESEKHKIKEDFEWWVTSIPDRIEILINKVLPLDLVSKKNSSIESLNYLEGFLIEKYDVNFFIQNNKNDFHDQLASYIGYIFQKELSNSIWYIELDNENDIYYGEPVIKSNFLAHINPHSLITTLLDRQKGDFLSKMLQRCILRIKTRNTV